MVYLTGDTHGSFDRLAQFCYDRHTARDDLVIVLGDVGLNYYGGHDDVKNKKIVSSLPATFFCIHGNHENRASNLDSYSPVMYHGGLVYYEPQFPNILFPADGQIFTLDGKACMVCGGAYSVDKWVRLRRGYRWWPDEQPSEAIRAEVETRLAARNWQVDVMLTHTCPTKYIPAEAFLPGVDQTLVDRDTEDWLDGIESKLSYSDWYCGHWHINKCIDRMHFLFRDFLSL